MANEKKSNLENLMLQYIFLKDMQWKHFWNCIEGLEKLWHILLEIVEHRLNILCPLDKIPILEGQMGWFDGEIKKAII